MEAVENTTHREPWNKGKIVGQKAPFKPKDVAADANLTRWSNWHRRQQA